MEIQEAKYCFSIVKSEFLAMDDTFSEMIWIRFLLCKLGFDPILPMRLFYDNNVVVHIANNPVSHERT